jgi:hypothetical protein
VRVDQARLQGGLAQVDQPVARRGLRAGEVDIGDPGSGDQDLGPVMQAKAIEHAARADGKHRHLFPPVTRWRRADRPPAGIRASPTSHYRARDT